MCRVSTYGTLFSTKGHFRPYCIAATNTVAIGLQCRGALFHVAQAIPIPYATSFQKPIGCLSRSVSGNFEPVLFLNV